MENFNSCAGFRSFDKDHRGFFRMGNSQLSNWRAGFFTVFVENISSRISKSALWEAFEAYGRVMDVYISFFNKFGKARPVTFAFVRFKFKWEMVRAIDEGNNRKLDGRLIRVNAATSGRSKDKWSRKENLQSSNFEVAQTSRGALLNPGVIKVNRSYKDAILGVNESSSLPEELGSQTREDDVFSFDRARKDNVNIKGVNYDLDIPHCDMLWLNRCAVGRLKYSSNFIAIQDVLAKNSINCSLSFLGGISVLVLFNSFEEMNGNLKDHSKVFELYFDDIKPWDNSLNQKNVAVWVSLEDVPLQIWHEKFFRSLGNSWGSFLKLDPFTEQKKRFDVARFLVMVERKSQIPNSVSINLRGRVFKISVSVDDTQLESLYEDDDLSDYTSDSDCLICKPKDRVSCHFESANTACSSNDEFLVFSRKQQKMLEKYDDLSLEEHIGGGGHSLTLVEFGLSFDNAENVLCDDVVFETEKFVPNSVDSSVIPFSRIISEGKLVVDLSVFGHLHNVVNDRFSMGTESVDDIGSEDGGSLETDSCDSEAEETWKISEALGLRFEGCKEDVIEVFKNLEKEDRSNFGC